MSAGSPTLEAAKLLSKGVHRLLVFHEGQSFSICSQSDIVRCSCQLVSI